VPVFDHGRAAEFLDRLIGGWTGRACNLNWPLTLAETAEIAAGLGATEHAEQIADELEPYTGELVVTGIGSFVWELSTVTAAGLAGFAEPRDRVPVAVCRRGEKMDAGHRRFIAC
jgi:hypothetical protein